MRRAHRVRSLDAMRGYDERSYGDGFADVYDEWYADVTDVDATVARMRSLAGPGGRVLELGVGTGRLAVPMAAAGLQVVGIDSSEAMLDRLTERDVTSGVTAIRGDMVDDLPDGPFDAALVAYNTIFNLLDETTQQRCFDEVAARLRPGGSFVVEAFVPDAERRARPTSDVSVRTLAVDHVVLSVSVDDPDNQRAEGQFVQISEEGGVRLRPWAIRWATPGQLDEMADRAGLTLAERCSDMAGAEFDDDSSQHVSIYTKRGAADGQ
jgi:SAM-dependent methyltransferase